MGKHVKVSNDVHKEKVFRLISKLSDDEYLAVRVDNDGADVCKVYKIRITGEHVQEVRYDL